MKKIGGIVMKRISGLVLWILSIAAAIVCLICDYTISTDLDWSLIVLLSLLAFGVLFTVALKANHPLRDSLVSITLLILPFLFILSMLLQQRLIFSLGGSIAVISCLFLWCVYRIYMKYKKQIYRAMSITFLITIPLVFSILYSCMHFLNYFTMDINSSVYHVLVRVVLSFISIVVDFAKSKTV